MAKSKRSRGNSDDQHDGESSTKRQRKSKRSSRSSRKGEKKSRNSEVSNGEEQYPNFDEEEAKRIADIAKRAEERAKQKEKLKQLENRANVQKSKMEENDQNEEELEEVDSRGFKKKSISLTLLGSKESISSAPTSTITSSNVGFLTKSEREKRALEKLHENREKDKRETDDMKRRNRRFTTGEVEREKRRKERRRLRREEEERERRKREENKEEGEREQELQMIRDAYLGNKNRNKKKFVLPSEKFARIFQFEWDLGDDTSEEFNPLYANKYQLNPMLGRGYLAGVDLQKQREESSFVSTLASKRIKEVEKFKKDKRKKKRSKKRKKKKRRDSGSSQSSQSSDTSENESGSDNDKNEEEEEEEGEGMGGMVDELKQHEKQRAEQMKRFLLTANTETNRPEDHWSHKKKEDMTERDWRIFREDFDIRVKGGKSAYPLRNWEDLRGVTNDLILRGLNDLGYDNPTPIQRQAIPICMDMRDMIGIAETGSGKTAAFVIPILHHILSLPSHVRERTDREGPLAVILAPVRELAQQIEAETKALSHHTNIKSMTIVGGVEIGEQGFMVGEGIDLLIATPGRLLDCLESHYLVLNQCVFICMDEADKMMNMGLEEELNKIFAAMTTPNDIPLPRDDHPGRMISMFSATMVSSVERVAKTYLHQPVVVTIGDEESGRNKRIEQMVVMASEKTKRSLVVDIISRGRLLRETFDEQTKELVEEEADPDQEDFEKPLVFKGGGTKADGENTVAPDVEEFDEDKFIVFVNSKRQVESVAKLLEEKGYRCGILHGGKTQDQRELALEQFKRGRCRVLVATDLAARGLDVPDVTHIINYDMPSTIETYCHRIGRTGRAGRSGKATSFLTDEDVLLYYDLRQYLINTNNRVPRELSNHPASKVAHDKNEFVMNFKADQMKKQGRGGGGGMMNLASQGWN